MTTDALDLLSRSIFRGGNFYVPDDFEITFDPVLEIEQTSTQARNFVFLEDNESLFLNDGFVRDFISGDGDADVVIGNTGTIGSSGRADPSITLTGNGQRAILNEGDILGGIQLGGGDDLLYTAGLIDGDVNMGGGDDIVLVRDFVRGGEAFPGEITGTLNTGSGNDVVVNGGLIGNVNLGSGDDIYNALALNGEIAAGGRISAGTGNDIIRGGASAERVYGGSGNDEIDGNDGNDWLNGGINGDTVRGGNGDDIITGGNGRDWLSGGSGDDTIHGGTGRDMIYGGRGDDMLNGQSGADTFHFFGRGGNDTIVDFKDNDLVVIDAPAGFPGLSFALIDSLLDYSGTGARLDLTELFEQAGLGDYTDGENSITWLDVADGALTADHFAF
ncbi:calcium-binding protein [Tateyamaria sp. SN3-11]|uniref:calcium-binding protein n=1 Tax=Tateyamaria sp. SN3-11 TaxID=3092147 RepID=UPI0039EB8B90